jgi:hypothetical protein
MPEKQLALMPDPINYGKHKLNIGGADMKAACDVRTTSPLIEYTTNIRAWVERLTLQRSLQLKGTKMSRQSKFVVSDLFREATAACSANTSHWMSAMRGTRLLFAHEANRINTIGQSSPRDDTDARLGEVVRKSR